MQYGILVALCWLVFVIYWGISAMSAKRTLNSAYGNFLWWRLGFIAIFIIILHFSGSRINIQDLQYRPSDIVGSLGVLCGVVGIALAIWARVYLASNWGMPMSVKENPELVTTGPYEYIRHPIYTGILLAMLGSALATGPFWAVVMLCAGIYFIYSSMQEEKLMLKEFPDKYPGYKARTKMLIPFIY
jgi:protein-S-isoprenylcysteine O-methyltransferase Ste14